MDVDWIGAFNARNPRHILSCVFIDMIYKVREGEAQYFKCDCQRCGKHIEFPSNGVGMTIDCPHCGKKTILGVATGSLAAKSKGTLWIALSLAVAIAVGALAAFLWSQKQKETALARAPKPAVAPAMPAASATQPAPSPAPDKPAAPVDTIDDFSVGKITLQKVQGSGLVYAVGTAKNAVDRQRFGVRIELNLLDEQDQNIGVVSDYVSVVEPQKDWQFRALLLPTQKGAAKVTVADIKEQK